MATTTIVFRGLMVFNKQADSMEIGFVDALYKPGERPPHSDHPTGNPPGDVIEDVPHDVMGDAPHDVIEDAPAPASDHADHAPVHIPRILTMKNGVLASIFDLRNRPELGTVRNWQLVVTNPLQRNVTTEEKGASFNRRNHPFDRDFRWITDLEADDLHGRSLSAEMNTRGLLMVLYVRNGDFYTKLKSPVLTRRQLSNSEQVGYGSYAAVVGCDIKCGEGGGVRLMAGGSSGTIAFDFIPEEGTIYEISNGPPDVPAEEPTPLDAPGHFHMYYDKLFNAPPADQFDIVKDDGAPAPDPAVCGVIYLGQREDPL